MKTLARNDLCWCGSGKKYKKCHMDDDMKNPSAAEIVKPSKGVIIKNRDQIEGIRKSCRLTKEALDLVAQKIRQGISTNELNNIVHDFIISNNAVPAPLNYFSFPKSICTSINNVICHGIPDDTVLKNGDIINVDVTTILNGYYGDAGRMFLIGEVSKEAERLVKVARECLYIGIEQVKPFQDLSNIGKAIEKHAKLNGFTVVRDYGGHGIGLKFHEEPHVHHYSNIKSSIMMIPDMTFTIEPMINAGGYESRLLSDNWTAVTADGSLSAQWEHTVRVTENGVEILTE